MRQAKLILAPFAAIFWLIAKVRRWIYNRWLNRYQSSVRTLGVGNLSMGGTGKTPTCDFIIRELMLDGLKVGYLSRGYGRLAPGLIKVQQDDLSTKVGDEALQTKQVHPGAEVVVCENRVQGLKYFEKETSVDVVIMDDGFQHLRVRADRYFLLTSFSDPYHRDFLFPAGFLREPIAARKEADALIVTKCPPELSGSEAQRLQKKLRFDGDVFFSTLKYGEFIEPVFSGTQRPFESLSDQPVVLITGIANPTPLVDEVSTLSTKVKHLKFKDHRNFDSKDIEQILQEWNADKTKVFLTTQKDAVRLATHPFREELSQLPLFYCTIEMKMLFDRHDGFKKLVKEYVS